MKKYIKNTNDLIDNLPTLEEISILMDADISQYIESVDLIGEGALEDTQVVADWKNFMTLVEGYINRHENLALLYDKAGNKLRKFPDVEGSHYYYIGVKDAEGKFTGKVVVDLRLSTHESTRKSGKARSYFENLVLKIIQKKYPKATEAVPKDLIINKKTFKNYDQAAMAILGMLENIANNYCR